MADAGEKTTVFPKGRCDLTGAAVGRWTVVRRALKTGYWECRCECGSEKDVAGWSLKNGQTTSCGCYNLERINSQPREDLVGQRFGRLTVLRRSERLTTKSTRRNPQCRHWVCLCDCGKETAVFVGSLKSGDTTSCGCFRSEATTAMKTKHGHAPSGKHSGEYRIWSALRGRCDLETNPNYRHYGGRGITVCDRWRDNFEAFLEDVGPRPSPKHSIDRIDVNGNYEPSNVRWATPTQQARNTRHNRLLAFNGETMPMSAWAERLGMEQRTLGYRIRAGWTIEKALTTPVGV